jgi:transketolase
LAVEAATGIEWYKYADTILSMNSFGASGDAGKLFDKYGFTIRGIKKAVFDMLDQDYIETEIKDCKI